MAVRIVAVMFTTLGIAPPLLEKLGALDEGSMPVWAELLATGIGTLLIGYAQKAKWLGDLNLLDVPPHIRESISSPPPAPAPVSDGHD